MKKFILMSLVATFAFVFSASAQENSYSIIIKMANGSTFTIGPNEVDNITFDNGEVTISGVTVDDLVERIDALREELIIRQEYLSGKIYESANETETALQSLEKDLNEKIDALDKRANVTETRLYDVAEVAEQLNEKIDALDNWANKKISELQDRTETYIVDLIDRLVTLEARIVVLEQE